MPFKGRLIQQNAQSYIREEELSTLMLFTSIESLIMIPTPFKTSPFFQLHSAIQHIARSNPQTGKTIAAPRAIPRMLTTKIPITSHGPFIDDILTAALDVAAAVAVAG